MLVLRKGPKALLAAAVGLRACATAIFANHRRPFTDALSPALVHRSPFTGASASTPVIETSIGSCHRLLLSAESAIRMPGAHWSAEFPLDQSVLDGRYFNNKG